MDLVGKLDDIGRPAWIGLMVLSFIVFWPVGLALLAFLLWSGRMGCGRRWAAGHWYRGEGDRDRTRDRSRGTWWPGPRGQGSGNRAFDEYRAETLRRLEEEQTEFHDFLDRLRHAKDKAEFDQFMADRGRRREAPEPPPAPEA